MEAGALELPVHTGFLFLHGAALPREPGDQAGALGYSAPAVTAHDGLYGAGGVAPARAGVGIQPITGAELSVTSGHLTLLAETERGYANLCRLITLAHRNTRVWEAGATHRLSDDPVKPRLTPEALAQHSTGLIVLTGCRH